MSAFVDEAQLHARAGDGGAGSVAFRREAHVDRGGPDGGDGGRGGDVWLEATTNQSSLLGFRDHPHRRATDGGHGAGSRRHGARGTDVVVPVPVGTVVRDRAGEISCDLSGPGDRWLAAEGGRGGRGNARFATSTRRAPGFAEQGERGEETWYDLELKLAADVALVGLPNVGKSTLISVVSAAKPKIADYPFTTLEPHLGVVRVDDERDFVMADVPGLVEGAAEGRGLGHRFLRHVERSRVLLVLLDLAPLDEVTPAAQREILERELGRYQPELLARPRLVIGSKADLVAEADAGDAAGVDLRISSATGAGVRTLVLRLAELVDAARAEEAAEAADGGVVVHRPAPEGLHVVRVSRGVWQIEGRQALRAVALSDLTDDGALDEAVRRLRRLGVDRALSRAGARDGDEVQIGVTSFTWYRDGAEPREDDETAAAGRGRRGRRRTHEDRQR